MVRLVETPQAKLDADAARQQRALRDDEHVAALRNERAVTESTRS